MGKTFSKPLNSKQPKSPAEKEAKKLADHQPNGSAVEVAAIPPVDSTNQKQTLPAAEAKDVSSQLQKSETKQTVETPNTTSTEPSSSTTLVSSSSAALSSSTPLPETKRVLSSAPLLYSTTLTAATTLDDYLKNTTFKSTPGWLFKDVAPFQLLTSTTLVNEEVDTVAELAIRIRDLRRTMLHDLAQLSASEEPVLAAAKAADHARDRAPADAKAQRLLIELQTTVDQLYSADKPDVASQRAAYLAKLQPYSSRETSLTQADRAGLRLLKGELEDVQEALAVSTPALTS